MSKVIAFIGSPRKNGYSTELLNRVLEGAKSMGAEIVTYNLNDEKIRGCQGCFYCRTHDGCATKDTLQPMYKDIAEADGIVASFPMYFGGIGGQTKVWLDRMYPMLDATFSPRHPNIKLVTIYSQGNVNPDFMKDTITANDMYLKIFGWDLLKSFLIHNTNDPENKIDNSMLQEAYEYGKSLVK